MNDLRSVGSARAAAGSSPTRVERPDSAMNEVHGPGGFCNAEVDTRRNLYMPSGKSRVLISCISVVRSWSPPRRYEPKLRMISLEPPCASDRGWLDRYGAMDHVARVPWCGMADILDVHQQSSQSHLVARAR